MHNSLLNKAQLWRDRTDIENTDSNINWLKQYVVGFDDMSLNINPWVFSHIPKTAGTSLESYLTQAFELKDILNINAPDLNNLPQCVYLKNKYPKFITGHHPIHGMLFQLLPNQKIVHLTMMRDPIRRVISYYNYIATREYHALHKQIKDLSFDAFLEEDLVEIHNGQAKRLAGILHSDLQIKDSDLYFKAKYTVDNCYSLVGVTEYFKQFTQVLAKTTCSTFTQLPAINQSITKVQLTDLTQPQLKIIKQNNKVDIQLYQYVKSKFLLQFEAYIQ